MPDWLHEDANAEFVVDDPEPIDPGLYTPFTEAETPPYQFEYEGSFSLDIGIGDSTIASLMDEQVAAELERIEYAIRGAILAGYDGVECYRQPTHATVDDIVPWEGEPPEPPRGVETERYCWPWFDEDELVEIAATGEVPQALLEVDDG